VMLDQVVPFFTAATASSNNRTLDNEMFTASQLFDSGVAGQTVIRVASERATDDPALALAVRMADEAERHSEDLRIDLATEQAKPDDERDAAREKALAASLSGATADSEALNNKLRVDFPAYVQLVAPGAVSLEELQHALHPHEAFMSFLIGVRASYVLLATHDDLTVRPVPVTRDALAADVADLRSAFVPRLDRLPDFSLAKAAALYRELLGPVSAQLADVDHLVVTANGDLSNLPFSLLVTDEGVPGDYVDAAWLIRRMAVSQIPSARAFVTLRANPATAAPRPFLGVGDPDFSGNQGGQALAALASACQEGASIDPALLRSLPPLPETAGEVRTIAATFNAGPDDMLLGSNASEANLRARSLGQYAVLYFATHAMLPGELHCQAQPGLVLTPPAGAASADNDGLLTAGEIAGLRLNAGLVVLSACNTAAAGGSRFGGSALEGLAEAFFSAGAHAVLASHWEVPSLATTTLMTTLFVQRAQNPGHDTAEALRQAQLALIAQQVTANPYQWAAFSLIGDGT
jgi:CHAT domain-containing protein